jgi:putative acetyltransferase
MFVRRERPGDQAAIAAVHSAAFARPLPGGRPPPEVRLVADLRICDGWIPALSIVAIEDGAIVGHVVCTRATIAARIPVLGLGPLGVVPVRQRAGVGKALMHAVVGAADALDERLIALLGNPEYYSRYGFEPSRQHGVEPPHEFYGDHFQVRLLTAATGAERGPFRYAAPFDALD